MKKTIPLIIILTIIAFMPAVLGAVLGRNGTGVLPLDLVLFTILPFLVLSLLLHFLFKYPSEVSAAPVKAASYSGAHSMDAMQSETGYEALSTAEPEAEAATEVAAEPEITCPECGGKVTMHDPACPHCGVKFEEEKGEEAVTEQPPIEQPEAEPETEILPEAQPEEAKAAGEFALKCPTCGGTVGLEEKFCPHCGADFEEKETGAAKSEAELDELFGIAPETKEAPKEEPKPEPQKSDEITLTYEEPEEEMPAAKNKKGKKRR